MAGKVVAKSKSNLRESRAIGDPLDLRVRKGYFSLRNIIGKISFSAPNAVAIGFKRIFFDFCKILFHGLKNFVLFPGQRFHEK